MIIDYICDAARYFPLHSGLKVLFDYLEKHDLSQAAPGRITIDGDNLFINVAEVDLKTREEQKLEVHRAYIDVHIPLSGEEITGWRHLSTLGEPDAPFDEKGDFALYSEPATDYFTLRPGRFCLDFPEDAHAPIIGEGKMRKLIAKIRISDNG